MQGSEHHFGDLIRERETHTHRQTDRDRQTDTEGVGEGYWGNGGVGVGWGLSFALLSGIHLSTSVKFGILIVAFRLESLNSF